MAQRRSSGNMVFCHECENEWFRSQGGLTCPRCHSDFTEIIETSHDPRRDYHQEAPALHEDLLAPDPEEADISRPPPVGQAWPFAMPGTAFNQYPPSSSGSGQPAPNTVAGNFASMLAGMLGINAQQPAQTAMFPGGQATTRTYNLGSSRITFSSTSFSSTYPPTSSRFPPTGPRSPGDDLQHMMSPFLFGGGGPMQHPVMGGGNMPANNTLASLLEMVLNPASAQQGDAVFTQEAMDRVISQLMEQNNMGNAPGPAASEDLASLPKVNVTKAMLDDEGRAECSICMDEVLLGDEVTQLYCSHWFHEACANMWLSEHDTCPHCRKGIREAREEKQIRADAVPQASTPPRAERSRRTPSFSTRRRSLNDAEESPSNASPGGGLTDRVRSFFGRN